VHRCYLCCTVVTELVSPTTMTTHCLKSGTEPKTDLKGGKARLISVCDLDEGG
jgi:hypothetical protein